MGCCQSSTRRQPDGSTSRHGDSSSHNHQSSQVTSTTTTTTTTGRRQRRRTASNSVGTTTNDPPPQPPPSTTTTTTRRGRRGRRQQNGANESLSQPLRPHVWASERAYTRASLDREREEFFDTRVTGRAETWHAIRMSLETLGEGDLGTAQTILDAAGVVLPTGDLVNGAYDEVGNFYQIPEYCVSDPVNLIVSASDGNDKSDDRRQKDEDEALEEEEEEDDDDDDDDVSDAELRRIRREEKGKGKAVDDDDDDGAGRLVVRARLSDRGGPDLRVELGRYQPVRVLVRRIQDELLELSGGATSKGKENRVGSRRRPVRIAYLGKILKENESLVAQGWKEGHVVNALVFP